MKPDATPTSCEASLERLSLLQNEDGSWQGEVIWSPIITAQAVIVHAIVGHRTSEQDRVLTLLYFRRTACPGGGWGLHPQSAAYLFVTTLVYVAARLLGAPADDAMLVQARAVIAATPGGIRANPQWGRFWLALIGLYDRDELNACPPELFLLSRQSALSPQQFYCHTRYIYLAMAYLSGSRFQADLGPVTEALRRELPGAGGEWRGAHRVPVAAGDLHERPGAALQASFAATRILAPIWRATPGSPGLRARALATCLDRIRYEQRVTSWQGLSPVSGLLNCLCLFANDPDDPDVTASLAGVAFWRWKDETDGIRYAGARSTAWDTSFALQTLAAGDPADAGRHAATIRLGYRSLCIMQARDDVPDRVAQGRDINRGGWCFTEGAQAWPVSDCTAEAVLALLDCEALDGVVPAPDRLPRERLADAANFILSRQNEDGGFGSYERRRGRTFLEHLNPSEMFGRCMTELTYVECTASSIAALHRILETEAPVDQARLERAIRRGTEIILSRQRPDGSWPGFWGINFVYGTLFALRGLRDAGIPVTHPSVMRARLWLEGKQKSDGGWGEHFQGCATGAYVDNPDSLVITTAWATLALLLTGDGQSDSARRGGEWLRRHQDQRGDWPRDSVNGVFFGTAMLDYRLYNTYFPAMALAKLETKQASHG